MDLHIHLQGHGHLARQIYAQLRGAILSGRLRQGDRLPPTRQLALRLAVSRNTVSLAYEWLTSEGLLSGRKGAGSFIDSEPAARSARARAGVAIRHRPVWDSIDAPASREHTPRYDFGVGMPDAALFPFDAWRRAANPAVAVAGGLRRSRRTSKAARGNCPLRGDQPWGDRRCGRGTSTDDSSCLRARSNMR